MSTKHHMQDPSRDREQQERTPTLLSQPHTAAPHTMWRLVLVAVLGLIVGFVIGALVFRVGDAPNVPEATDSAGETSTLAEDTGDALPDESGRVELSPEDTSGENVVLVKDQSAGNSVFLSRVELTAPGWVVVQEDNGGTPGNILGAQRFDAGVYQGTVLLLRPIESGRTYHASIWRDNGDKLFDLEVDTPVVGVSRVFETY